MKKSYESPLAKLLLLYATDILTASGEDDYENDLGTW